MTNVAWYLDLRGPVLGTRALVVPALWRLPWRLSATRTTWHGCTGCPIRWHTTFRCRWNTWLGRGKPQQEGLPQIRKLVNYNSWGLWGTWHGSNCLSVCPQRGRSQNCQRHLSLALTNNIHGSLSIAGYFCGTSGKPAGRFNQLHTVCLTS